MKWQDVLKLGRKGKKKKTLKPDYSIQQGYHSDLKENLKRFIDNPKLREVSTAKLALQKC